MSVAPSSDELNYISQNPKGLGHYKRAELNTKTSEGELCWTEPWIDRKYRHKVVRIFMPQKKHVHCHPTNKYIGKYWALDFGGNATGHFKSLLMGWTRAGADPYSFMCTPYQSYNMHVKFGTLIDAVQFCERMGWGYDILHPKHRWHVKKNYADNFKWKGEPKSVQAYD